jgi:hypothetical protein
MGSDWLELLDRVLRPARPGLSRCLAERSRHLERGRDADAARALELSACEQRIIEARAAVFAAADGVVSAGMTELERQWRRLARLRAEQGMMELWASLSPASWIDHKRFRDSPPARWLDAAVALAADVEGVERAEQAVVALRLRLAPFGKQLAGHVRWRLLEQDPEPIGALLAGALRAARDACPAPQRATLLERGRHAERVVLAAALERLPDRPLLARDVAHAAQVDCVWRLAGLPERENPVGALRALWQTGYVLSEVEPACITLELPPLSASAH